MDGGGFIKDMYDESCGPHVARIHHPCRGTQAGYCGWVVRMEADVTGTKSLEHHLGVVVCCRGASNNSKLPETMAARGKHICTAHASPRKSRLMEQQAKIRKPQLAGARMGSQLGLMGKVKKTRRGPAIYLAPCQTADLLGGRADAVSDGRAGKRGHPPAAGWWLK